MRTLATLTALALSVGLAAAQNLVLDGPAAPLTPDERQAFQSALAACWNTDTITTDETVTLLIAFALNPDGSVIDDEVRLVRDLGRDPAAAAAAFETARRAILRCQGVGSDSLPPESYAQWRDMRVTVYRLGMTMQ